MTNEVLVADQTNEYKDVHSSFEKLLSPKGKKKIQNKKNNNHSQVVDFVFGRSWSILNVLFVIIIDKVRVKNTSISLSEHFMNVACV